MTRRTARPITSPSGCCSQTEAAVGRDDLLRLLAEAGISARRGIMAAHLEPAYADPDAMPCP